MAKKKISFDIDDELFDKVKFLSKKEKIGQGEFLRRAVNSYVDFISKKENIKTLTFYAVYNGRIEKFIIPKDDKILKVTFTKPKNELKKLVPNVENEGILYVENFTDTLEIKNKKLQQVLEDFKYKVPFFTVKETH